MLGFRFAYLLLVCVTTIPVVTSNWWKIGNSNLKNIPRQTIMDMHRFNRKQKLFVETTPEFLEVIQYGAKLSIRECKRQFQNRKWNCSTDGSLSVFGKILNRVWDKLTEKIGHHLHMFSVGRECNSLQCTSQCSSYQHYYFELLIPRSACRETSFIYAIMSAGITYSFTESCAKGFIKGCHCRQSGEKTRKKTHWVYEGCNDNIRYGYENGGAFVDATEESQDFNSILNIHNNKAGRLAVVDSMTTQCKCHGVSGNCNVKTCRKALPVFKKIGKLLQGRYDTATKVQAVQITGNRRITKKNLGFTDQYTKRPSEKDLVYFEESPDFCETNISEGSLGTKGRFCDPSINAKSVVACNILCCGRKWKAVKLTLIEKCKCIFKWCCGVTCQKCKVVREYSLCT